MFRFFRRKSERLPEGVKRDRKSGLLYGETDVSMELLQVDSRTGEAKPIGPLTLDTLVHGPGPKPWRHGDSDA